MKPNSFTRRLCSIICILLFCVQFEGCVGSNTKRTDEAYVTLLYGDEFLLGVRVLGKSIRNTGSNKDMVVLVSDGVSDYAKNLLQVIIIFFLMGLTQSLKFLSLPLCWHRSFVWFVTLTVYLVDLWLKFFEGWRVDSGDD